MWLNNFFKIILIFLILEIICWKTDFCNGAGLMQNYTSDLLRLAKSAEIRTFMNRQKKPCDNFYKFACGNWKNVKIAPMAGKSAYLDQLKELYWRKSVQMLSHSSYPSIANNYNNPNINENFDQNSNNFNSINQDNNIRPSLSSSIFDPPLDAKLKDFYRSCRSQNTSQAMLKNSLSAILKMNGILDGWPNNIEPNWYEYEYDWLRTIAELRRNLGVNILINLNIMKDFNNNNLSTPTQQYYLKLSSPKFDLKPETYSNIDDESIHQRNLYMNNIKEKLAKYFPEMKENWYSEIAQQILQLEQELSISDYAKRKLTTTAALTTNRNLRFRYPQELKNAYGNFVDLNRYLTIIFNQTIFQPIEEATPGYFTSLVNMIKRTPKMTIFNYTMWKIVQYLDMNSPPLASIDLKNFPNSETISSATLISNTSMNQFADNWCLEKVLDYFPAAMENMFGRTYQSMEMINHLQSIWSDVKRIFRNELLISDRLSWISLETRQKAAEKLDSMSLDIANLNMMSVYRGENNLEALILRHDNYYYNLVQILHWKNQIILNKFINQINNNNNNQQQQQPEEEEDEDEEEKERENIKIEENENNNNDNLYTDNSIIKLLNKINKQMLKGKNGFLPYYVYQTNRIRVPIKFLQIHFLWDASYPHALLYSSLGFLLAREMLKGFDTQGRKYDKRGYQLPWWDTVSEYGYNNRANCFLQQYSKYDFPGWIKTDNPNPKEVDELVVDNGALNIAYETYQQWWTNVADSRMASGEQLPFQRDLTQQQLFFLGFAQIWCADYNSQMDNFQQLPERWRVIGALANLNSFARDYKCPIGNKMNPEKKCYLF